MVLGDLCEMVIWHQGVMNHRLRTTALDSNKQFKEATLRLGPK